MAIATKRPGPRLSKAEYGSDVIVDVLRDLEIDYVSLNPGATFRGLHDSMVNYGGNTQPETILCTHEGIATSIAHGYGRAAGKIMAAAVHNIVGLLHATNAMFNAWQDRAGMLVLGGTGPMAVEQRRPWIDWIHTALVQGDAVRGFVKWDDQPASVASFPESLLRAHQLASMNPQGPVYVCFDAALQEQKLDEPFLLPDASRFDMPSRVQADPQALERAADLLMGAERPVVVADYLGKSTEAVAGLLRLAETLSLPVVDMGDLFSFPSQHPLNLSGAASRLISHADVILCLDVFDLQQALTTTDRVRRIATDMAGENAQIIDVSLRQYIVRSWADDYGRLYPVDVPIAADTALALPALADMCQRKLAEQPGMAQTIEERNNRLRAEHEELARETDSAVANAASDSPIALPALAQQVKEVVKGHDWVLTDNDLRGWARRIWDIREPYQYHSARGGLGNGIGRSLGVALANRGTGRLCVDFQADGDYLFNPAALWTAVHHRIPLLVVMYNNRSYYNDEEHQADIARSRGRSVENRVVGIRIEGPPVDFATMARSCGVYAEGPIEQPDLLMPALQRALKVVTEEGRPALLDVITKNR